MKCARHSKRIYLYHELDKDERQKVDLHLQSCQDCQRHFSQVQQDQAIVKDSFVSLTVTDNYVALTDRIMASINEKNIPKVYAVDRMLEFLQLNPIRYAMAVVSISLIGFYSMEFRVTPQPGQNIARSHYTSLQKDVELNSDFLREHVRQTFTLSTQAEQSKTMSLYDCIRVCKNNDYRNCIDCKGKISNIKI